MKSGRQIQSDQTPEKGRDRIVAELKTDEDTEYGKKGGQLEGPVRVSVERTRLKDASVTASVGYAVFPTDAASSGDLLVAADQALSSAQAAGGNTVRGTAELGADAS